MDPSTLEKLTVILFTAAGIVFISAVFYAVKFKVISSFLFEIEQKKIRKKNKDTDFLNIPPEKIPEPEESDTRREYQKLTGTVSVRRNSADISLLSSVPSEKTDSVTVSETDISENKETENIVPDSADNSRTVAAKKRKNIKKTEGVFSITDSITVIPCTYDDIRCIDEA